MPFPFFIFWCILLTYLCNGEKKSENSNLKKSWQTDKCPMFKVQKLLFFERGQKSVNKIWSWQCLLEWKKTKRKTFIRKAFGSFPGVCFLFSFKFCCFLKSNIQTKIKNLPFYLQGQYGFVNFTSLEMENMFRTFGDNHLMI